jgi:hypothetical protein
MWKLLDYPTNDLFLYKDSTPCCYIGIIIYAKVSDGSDSSRNVACNQTYRTPGNGCHHNFGILGILTFILRVQNSIGE